MSSTVDIQDLVDCFDDIPDLMKTMHKLTKSCPSIHPDIHQSVNVDSALRNHKPVDISNPSNKHKVDRMAQQAIKVLDQLSRIEEVRKSTNPPAPSGNGRIASLASQQSSSSTRRSVKETSTIVRDKLSELRNKGVDLNRFYAQYDVNRSGTMSYKDFSDTLLAVSSGIRRDEAQILASHIDKRKSGSLDYKTILNALEDISSSTGKENTASIRDTDIMASSNQRHQSSNDNEPRFSIKPSISFNYLPVKRDRRSTEYEAALRYDADGDIVRVESLCPNLQIGQVILRDDGPRTGRKQFHDRNKKIYGAENAPYRLDLPVGEESKRPTRRSSSAPPRSRTRSFDYDSDREKIAKEKEQSLRNLLDNKDSNAFTDDSSTNSKLELPCRPEAVKLRQAYQAAIKSPLRKRACFDSKTNGGSTSALENIVVSELGGKVRTLRHILKLQDKSQSGAVSCAEFKSALNKAGISLRPEESIELFNSYVKSDDRMSSKSALNGGKVLDIDTFVDRMQMKTCANAFSHLHESGGNGPSMSEKAKRAEEVRVMQKILQATNKSTKSLENIANSGASADRASVGLIAKGELKDSLNALGANLSHAEFDTLMISAGEKGLLSMDCVQVAPLADHLRRQVTAFQVDNRDEKQKQLQSSSRYNDTYRSSLEFGDEQHDVQDSSMRYNGVNKSWMKLRNALQNNSEKLLSAFSSSASGDIPIGQLRNRLQREGLALADDDVTAITARLGQQYGASSSVTLESMCEVAGLNTSVEGGKISLRSSRDFEVDGGIFAAGNRTLSSNPTYSSSLYCDGVEDTNKWASGEKRRKIPQSLYSHSLEPSKFWELSHTDPMALFPQPMPSLRDPLPPKLIDGRPNNVNMNTSTCLDNSINSTNSNYRNGNSGSYANGKFRSTDKRLLRSSLFLNYADSGDWIDRLTGMYSGSDGAGTDNSYYAATNNDSISNRSTLLDESFARRRQASSGGTRSGRQRSKSAPPRSSSVSSLLITPTSGIAGSQVVEQGNASLATYIATKQTPTSPSETKSLRQFIGDGGAAPGSSSQGRSLRRQYNLKSTSSCPYAVDAGSFSSESMLR